MLLASALDAHKRGWVGCGELQDGECIALHADDDAVSKLDFMPSAQGLCGAHETDAADEVPLGAVVAGYADAGTAR